MVTVSKEIQSICPKLKLGMVTASVRIASSSKAFSDRLVFLENQVRSSIQIEDIASLGANHDTRNAYRALGKKPGRYRPSAEALMRRMVSGKGLYKVNNVVDLLNYISISSLYSIGGYDFKQIQTPVQLRVGEKEPYNAISRGILNIEKLPVLYDRIGPFGSPTSDSERTMISTQTTQILWVIFNFGGDGNLNKWLEKSGELLEQFCNGEGIKIWIE